MNELCRRVKPLPALRMFLGRLLEWLGRPLSKHHQLKWAVTQVPDMYKVRAKSKLPKRSFHFFYLRKNPEEREKVEKFHWGRTSNAPPPFVPINAPYIIILLFSSPLSFLLFFNNMIKIEIKLFICYKPNCSSNNSPVSTHLTLASIPIYPQTMLATDSNPSLLFFRFTNSLVVVREK